jgi:TetR/AcrR family transcriptional regulator, mexJK operon transcriptional repressor
MNSESRSDRKRKTLLEAATAVFLEKGYDGTSMDDVAARVEVSKPTLYKYFFDKQHLFAEVVRATTDQIDDLVRLVVETMDGETDVNLDLAVLARRFINALMQPQVLRLRRLVIANADRFPDVGRSWYEQGFLRVLQTLATTFQSLADRQLLKIGDPLLAANHFVGLLLWIPVNKAMFTGDHQATPDELERYALAAVSAFLTGYGPSRVMPAQKDAAARTRRKG